MLGGIGGRTPLPYRSDPDFGRLLRVLRREGEPDRVPLVELFHDVEIMEAILGEPLPPAGPHSDRHEVDAFAQATVRFWHGLGYDYVCWGPSARRQFGAAAATAAATEGTIAASRSWQVEEGAVVRDRSDLASFRWPRPEDWDLRMLDALAKHLPDGMKIIPRSSGVFENVTSLVGTARFCTAVIDDPEFVEDVCAGIGASLLGLHRQYLAHPAVGAAWLGDDMGYRSGTMISPNHLRRHIFPWQRKLAEAAHAAGKPFLLHSCGDLAGIMDDLIDDVGIDAKHSFEDAILPVTRAKKRYGARIAILGGIDVDLLARGTPEQIRARTREVLDICAPGGGYGLGSGNSVANYIPVPNYLAMIEAAGEWNG